MRWFLIWLAIAAVIVVDALALTYFLPLENEANPLVLWICDHIGIGGFLALKIAAAIGLSGAVVVAPIKKPWIGIAMSILFVLAMGFSIYLAFSLGVLCTGGQLK